MARLKAENAELGDTRSRVKAAEAAAKAAALEAADAERAARSKAVQCEAEVPRFRARMQGVETEAVKRAPRGARWNGEWARSGASCSTPFSRQPKDCDARSHCRHPKGLRRIWSRRTRPSRG